MTLKITVPLPLNLANSRCHWRVKDKQRKAYFDALDWLALAKMIPAPPKQPLDSITLSVVMHLARQMDHDNAAARCKWPIDWLKTRRYIVDDSPAHLRWASFPEQRVKRDGNYRIELSLITNAA
jgi:hypothetical protein